MAHQPGKQLLHFLNTPLLHSYLEAVGYRKDPLKQRLVEETREKFGPKSVMQINPLQGEFMRSLVYALRPKKIVEVGVFTGYSSLCFASALPDDGHLWCLDVSEEWTNLAKNYWQEAGLTDKITLKLAPAEQSLNELIETHGAGSFDMMFIDADKSSYIRYYNLGLELLRPGGVILIDNTLWSGSVASEEANDEDTTALRELNRLISEDSRVNYALLPMADGLTFITKK
jgi:predicted O-methyltransferase YrrM